MYLGDDSGGKEVLVGLGKHDIPGEAVSYRGCQITWKCGADRWLQQIQFPGFGYSLRATANVELGIDIADVSLDSTNRDNKLFRYFAIRQASCTVVQHLQKLEDVVH
jgi:hypothetical protein